MELRDALLLIGIIVVAVVAFNAFDVARLARRLRAGRGTAGDARKPRAAVPPRLEPATGLDINLRPGVSSAKKRLQPDATGVPPPREGKDVFHEELESLEEVATMPLHLDAGFSRRRAGRSQTARPAAPDEKIDFVIRLPGATAVPRTQALGIFKQHEFDLDKPRRLYGLRFGTDRWSELQHDSERTVYGELALAIQLVDNAGPIGESELTAFSQIGLKLADVLHRPTKFSMSFEEALARARELHRFCEAYDVIAGVNVTAPPGQAFKGRVLETQARKLGLQFGAMNIFHMKNDFSPGCRHLFSLANLYEPGEFPPDKWDTFETAGLALFMSVPCAHHPAAVFDKMVGAAQMLAETLGGKLQDQEQRPLTAQGLAVIRGQIAEIEEKMRAFGVVPGSEVALRLFGETPAV
jgi:hypothetical protein